VVSPGARRIHSHVSRLASGVLRVATASAANRRSSLGQAMATQMPNFFKATASAPWQQGACAVELGVGVKSEREHAFEPGGEVGIAARRFGDLLRVPVSEMALWLPLTAGIVALLCYLLLPLPDGPWTWGKVGTETGQFGRPLMFVYEHVWPTGPRTGGFFWIILFFAMALFAYALFYALYHGLRRSGRLLFEEFVHALGFQFIPGAKVLDPAAVLPGQEVVDKQKAHGDARLASEAEARAAAAQGGGRTTVQDQEF
jgi:hypothetical protein